MPTKSSSVPPRPTTLIAGNHDYTIYWDAEAWARSLEMDGANPSAWAFTNHRLCEVFIRPGAAESQNRDSVLHETIHVINHQFGVNLESIRSTDVNLDEFLVSAQTPWLLMILRDNPDLVAFLTA